MSKGLNDLWFDGRNWGYQCLCGETRTHNAAVEVFICNCGHRVDKPTCTLAKQSDVGAMTMGTTVSTGWLRAQENSAAAAQNAMAMQQNDRDGFEMAWKNACVENARLRKELEAAKVEFLRHQGPEAYLVIEKERICDHEPVIAKLKAFSEDQARQIQKLEVAVAKKDSDLDAAQLAIGQQRMEPEKLKRRGR